MYKKCVNCYKDGKVPNEESCKKCEDDLKAKEQECEELKRGIVKQCPICGEQFLSHIGAELFEENTRLKQALDEI